MKTHRILLVIIIMLFFVSPSFSEVTVTSVTGQAKYKIGDKWLMIAPAQKLKVGTKVSTGVNSTIVLNINGDAITIKQMSLIKIDENYITSDETNTAISLKRGGLSARISKLKTLKTNFKISSPVATSSVRGTWEDFSFGPGMGARIIVYEGTIYAENNNGSSNLISGNLEFKQDNNNSVPDSPNSNNLEGSRGGLLNKLTPDEQNFMSNTTDFFTSADNPVPPVLQGAGGNANINIIPVFP